MLNNLTSDVVARNCFLYIRPPPSTMYKPAYSALFAKVPPQSQRMAEDEDYEVECIQDKRTCDGVVEYYVKWVGYHESENEWLALKDLPNARDLVDDYEQLLKKRKRFGKDQTSAMQPGTGLNSGNSNPKDHPRLVVRLPNPVSKVRSHLDTVFPSSGFSQCPAEKRRIALGSATVGTDQLTTGTKNRNLDGTFVSHPKLEKPPSAATTSQSRGIAFQGSALTRPPRRPLVEGVDFLRVRTDGHSGVESGKLVVDIIGFKPAGLHIRRLDDIQYLINYADHPQEYVPHAVCVEHIPIHVTEYLGRTPILLLGEVLER